MSMNAWEWLETRSAWTKIIISKDMRVLVMWLCNEFWIDLWCLLQFVLCYSLGPQWWERGSGTDQPHRRMSSCSPGCQPRDASGRDLLTLIYTVIALCQKSSIGSFMNSACDGGERHSFEAWWFASGSDISVHWWECFYRLCEKLCFADGKH